MVAGSTLIPLAACPLPLCVCLAQYLPFAAHTAITTIIISAKFLYLLLVGIVCVCVCAGSRPCRATILYWRLPSRYHHINAHEFHRPQEQTFFGNRASASCERWWAVSNDVLGPNYYYYFIGKNAPAPSQQSTKTKYRHWTTYKI